VQLSIPDYTAISLDVIDQSWTNLRSDSWPSDMPRSVEQLLKLPENVQVELKEYFKIWSEFETTLKVQNLLSTLENGITKVNRIDLARDGHHFDQITAQWVVDQIANQSMTASG
jgi:hypothetical protein